MPDDATRWDQDRAMVLDRLARLESTALRTDGTVTKILVAVGELKVRSGLWGAAAGGVITAGALLLLLLKGAL